MASGNFSLCLARSLAADSAISAACNREPWRLIGEAAEALQLELPLMSNNIKSRKTISVMTLATHVIERPDLLKKITDAWPYIHVLRQQAAAATGHAEVPS